MYGKLTIFGVVWYVEAVESGGAVVGQEEERVGQEEERA